MRHGLCTWSVHRHLWSAPFWVQGPCICAQTMAHASWHGPGSPHHVSRLLDCSQAVLSNLGHFGPTSAHSHLVCPVLPCDCGKTSTPCSDLGRSSLPRMDYGVIFGCSLDIRLIFACRDFSPICTLWELLYTWINSRTVSSLFQSSVATLSPAHLNRL